MTNKKEYYTVQDCINAEKKRNSNSMTVNFHMRIDYVQNLCKALRMNPEKVPMKDVSEKFYAKFMELLGSD